MEDWIKPRRSGKVTRLIYYRVGRIVLAHDDEVVQYVFSLEWNGVECK